MGTTDQIDADRLPVEHDRLQVQIRIAPRTVIMVGLIALTFWVSVQLAQELSTVLFWLVTAVFLAMASDPAVQWFQRQGLTRGWSIASFFGVLVATLAIASAVFVPVVVEQSEELINTLPGYVREIRASDWFQSADERFDVLNQATTYLQELPGEISDGVGSTVNGVINGAFGVITIILLTVFLLVDGERLIRGALRTAPQLGERRWWRLSTALYTNVGRYVAGRLMVSGVGAISLLIVASILGMPSAVPLALWMFLLGLIPMVGAAVGSLPALLVACFYADPLFGSNVAAALVLLGYIVVYQQLENAVIEPRIVGKTVSLAPFMVFISILIGGSLLGVIGALMAIPVAGVLQVALSDLTASRGFGAEADAVSAGAVEPGEIPDGDQSTEKDAPEQS